MRCRIASEIYGLRHGSPAAFQYLECQDCGASLSQRFHAIRAAFSCFLCHSLQGGCGILYLPSTFPACAAVRSRSALFLRLITSGSFLQGAHHLAVGWISALHSTQCARGFRLRALACSAFAMLRQSAHHLQRLGMVAPQRSHSRVFLGSNLHRLGNDALRGTLEDLTVGERDRIHETIRSHAASAIPNRGDQPAE